MAQLQHAIRQDFSFAITTMLRLTVFIMGLNGYPEMERPAYDLYLLYTYDLYLHMIACTLALSNAGLTGLSPFPARLHL